MDALLYAADEAIIQLKKNELNVVNANFNGVALQNAASATLKNGLAFAVKYYNILQFKEIMDVS